MMRFAVWLGLLLALPLAAAEKPAERPKVAIVNGTAEADQVQVWTNGSMSLTGNVVVHVERLGDEPATADLTAAKVTVVVGQDKQGHATLTKLFAAGKVHIEATTTDEVKGEKRTLVSDCDRLTYIAGDGVMTLSNEGDKPVVAHVNSEMTPNTTNKLKAPQTYHFDVTARRTLEYRLNGQPAEALEATGKP